MPFVQVEGGPSGGQPGGGAPLGTCDVFAQGGDVP